jgi:hypothetical protein
MIPEKKLYARNSIGIGILFLLIKPVLYTEFQASHILLVLALICDFIGVGVFTWGCMNYVEGKGFSKWIGLVGLLSILGFLYSLLVLWCLFFSHTAAEERSDSQLQIKALPEAALAFQAAPIHPMIDFRPRMTGR